MRTATAATAQAAIDTAQELINAASEAGPEYSSALDHNRYMLDEARRHLTGGHPAVAQQFAEHQADVIRQWAEAVFG